MFSSKSKKDIHSEFEERMLRLIIRRARVRPDESVFPLIMRFDDKLQHLYNLFFYLNEYNIHPDTARQSAERLPFAKMQPNGDGVAEVIDALEKRSFDRIELARYYGMESFMGYDYPMTDFPYYAYPHRYDYRFRRYTPTELQRVYKQAFENINKELSAAVKPIESVSVKIDETNGKRFVVFRAGKETFYPQEVSDGTIKWLCILVSIFVPYSSVYILEEPENFLHPWMQQRLISMMREHAKINNAIFVLASHSSTVLNSAFAEEVLIVSQTKDGTKINEIADKEEIERVLLESDFRLGDFWVSGALGGVP
ncbi:MAG: AAA family ATPase [Dehalococcoidia bacterium]